MESLTPKHLGSHLSLYSTESESGTSQEVPPAVLGGSEGNIEGLAPAHLPLVQPQKLHFYHLQGLVAIKMLNN